MKSNQDEPGGVHVWLILMKAFRALEKYANHSIQHTGLCYSDFAVLEVLLHKEPLPVNTIGAKISLTSGSATTAVDRLEARRLVRREDDLRDRRTRIVQLTLEGRKLIETAFRLHSADMEKVLSVLPVKQQRVLAELLKTVGREAIHAERDAEILTGKGE